MHSKLNKGRCDPLFLPLHVTISLYRKEVDKFSNFEGYQLNSLAIFADRNTATKVSPFGSGKELAANVRYIPHAKICGAY